MPAPRAVVCISTGEWFPSIVEAARAIDRQEQSLRQAIKHPCRCAGMVWAYADGRGPGDPLVEQPPPAVQ
eukprot:g35351.t1